MVTIFKNLVEDGSIYLNFWYLVRETVMNNDQ